MVEYFLKEKASQDDRIVGVSFASPGIDQSLDYLGSDRIIRFEHSNDVVVDAAQEFGTPGIFQDIEFDLKVVLGENDSIQGGAEHGARVYTDTASILFSSPFAAEILRDYEFMRTWIGFDTGQTMQGVAGRDVIFGQGGVDYIYGEGSRDLIDGGAGGDFLYGGFGNDLIYGGTEGDLLRGEGNIDYLYGESGVDVIYGDEGADYLYGGADNDTLRGGTEIDRLFGDEDNDTLIGEGGNDILDGGTGDDTAEYSGTFGKTGGGFNYKLVSLGGTRFTVQDLRIGSPDGTDTLDRIEFITFKTDRGTETLSVTEWFARAGGPAPTPSTPDKATPYVPPNSTPSTPTPTFNSLLSVTPVNKQLTVGGSVFLTDLFPSALWVDNDGPRDIVRFSVQDRTAGGGFFVHQNKVVAANTVFEMEIAELANWRFVAGASAATDNIGFNIIQADGDFSPRLTTGAVVTTVVPIDTKPADPTPIVVPGMEVARLDLDLRNGSSINEGDSAQFTIQRRGNQSGDIVVEWRIEGRGDNPADRRDFPAMSGTLTLYDDRGDRNFSIGLTRDQVDELNEGFRIALRVVSGNAVFDDDDANLTIIDDDVPLGIDPTVDDHGNSLATATIVPEDRWSRGFIEQPGDQDYFRFDLLGGVGYEFILVKDNDLSLIGGDPNANYATLPQPIAELYDSNGQLIATLPATSLSTRWAFRYETVADGTFYLRVRENGDNDVGQYFVQADIRVQADDFSANASTTATLTAGSSITGHHERSTDVDWIAVDLVAGEKYRFSLIGDKRLLVDDGTGGVNGSNGWYFFGWDGAGFSLVNSAGSVIASRTSTYPLSSNLIEFEAAQSGRFYVAVDGSTDQMYNYVVNFDQIKEQPAAPALVLQPGADGVVDFRFASINDTGSVAIVDETLTVNGSTSSAIRFNLTEQNATASYAAIEIYLFASGGAVTGDIAVDVPLNALNAGSTFANVGSIEFVTAVQTTGIGQWVTIEITDLYNQSMDFGRTPQQRYLALDSREFESVAVILLLQLCR